MTRIFVPISHILTSLSEPPVAKHRPFGEKATAFISPSCPCCQRQAKTIISYYCSLLTVAFKHFFIDPQRKTYRDNDSEYPEDEARWKCCFYIAIIYIRFPSVFRIASCISDQDILRFFYPLHMQLRILQLMRTIKAAEEYPTMVFNPLFLNQ